MADVSKIQGPNGPPTPPRKEQKADSDKFKDAMQRKVKEVGAVDPDEQKKRRQPGEPEEEQPIDGAQGPTAPPTHVTPFDQPSKISPSEMQSGGYGRSPMNLSQTEDPAPPTASFYTSPSSSEMEDDSGTLEQNSFSPSSPLTPQKAQDSQVGPPKESQQSNSPQDQEKNSAEAPPPIPPAPSGKKEEKKGTTAESLESVAPKKTEDTETFYRELGSKEDSDHALKDSKKNKEELAEETISAPLPFPQGLKPGGSIEHEEKKGIDKEVGHGGGTPTGAPQSLEALPLPLPEPLAAERSNPYANLHPQVAELFDRMVGTMTVMNHSGISETTLTLNSHQFASSVFFNSQIIIKEFSTAPKAFNIQINASPQALNLMGNAEDLLAAFQHGNYNFRVNRFETGHLTDRPLFKRKGKAGEDNKDQTGGNQQ